LVPHPASPPKHVAGVVADVWADPEEVLLTFKVEGSEALRLPEWATPKRRDELWMTSCFELFLQPAGAEEYFEFNLSPSSEWAAYRFSGYREDMAELVMPVEPFVDRGVPPDEFVIEADVDLSAVPAGALRMGLSAVIEELDGTKSFWALRHPPGDKPDFHHPDCFAVDLSPASGT
jgi:hypothetical protein